MLIAQVAERDDIRVLVLGAPADSRAWCAGADLKEVAVAGSEGRQERYDVINETLPAFYHLDRPVIAAINGHCLGMGMVWASLCDIRIAATDALFSLPEIERGMAAPLATFFARLNMPSGITRELLFTGRKFAADEIAEWGFLNAVVPRDAVLEHSVALARRIAGHRAEAVRATKTIANASEGLDWLAAYKMGQSFSTRLAGAAEAKQAIETFFDRDANR